LHRLDWRIGLYAILSLTLVRMVPVALALAGLHARWPTVGFVGWFGPRGLASVIFALLALEDLHDAGSEVVAVIALTVLLSVLAHGISAGPFGRAFPDPTSSGTERPHHEPL
jgi:NhaP-type Na+/H+ or K+/H+ antiporter